MSCQCEGKTKAGAKCQKKTKDASKRCHLHRNAPAYAPPEPETVIVVPEEPKNKPEEVKTKTEVSEGKQELSEQCSDKSECCVCYDEMPEADKLDCGHCVCRGCIKQLRNDKCPMCRKTVSARHITSAQKKKMSERFRDDRFTIGSSATADYIASLSVPHLPVTVHPPTSYVNGMFWLIHPLSIRYYG
jgi:hypothetical protein